MSVVVALPSLSMSTQQVTLGNTSHQQTNTYPFGAYGRLSLLAINFSFSECLIFAFCVLSQLLLLIIFTAHKSAHIEYQIAIS
jgi:hypothetical protein